MHMKYPDEYYDKPFYERMLEIGPKILRFYLSYTLFFKEIFNFFY